MSTTTKLYWTDAYLRTAQTTIAETVDEGVVLDATIFCVRGGGQPGDTGTLNGQPVTDTRMVGERLVHFVDDPGALRPGDDADAELDWERRNALMRHHSLLHVVHLAVQATADAPTPLGSEITTERARIEYATSDIDVPAVVAIVDEIVASDLTAITTIVNGQRTWSLPGWPPIPCGGTHVAGTAEIGAFELRTKSAGRRGTRLYAACV